MITMILMCGYVWTSGLEPVFERIQSTAGLTDALVLLIGVNGDGGRVLTMGACSAELEPLKAAALDVGKLEALILGAGGTKNQIEVLRNHGATLQGVENAFGELETASAQGSRTLLFVSWSGHGVRCKSSDQGDESYALVAHDGLLPLKKLLTMFESPKIQVHNRVLVLDACYAGGVLSSRDISTAMTHRMEQQKNQVVRTGNSLYLVSAKAGQEAWESPQGGFFFGALLRGLNGLALEDLSSQSTVQLHRVFAYASYEMRAHLGELQVPLKSGPDLAGPIFTRDQTCADFYPLEVVGKPIPKRLLASRPLSRVLALHRDMQVWSRGSQVPEPEVFFAYKRHWEEARFIPLKRVVEGYRLDIGRTVFPPTAKMIYWFEIEYGSKKNRRRLKTCRGGFKVFGS